MSSRNWPLHEAADYLFVFLGWAAIVVSSALLPVEDLGLRSTVLFLHLVCVPIGFGAVVMMNVYTALWLMGRKSYRDVLALAGVAHCLMAGGLAGLIATGIALDPDLDSTLMRVKLVLLLALMLNAVKAHQSTGNLATLPSRAVGWRIVVPAVVSQIAWWGTIGIGFVTTTSR